MKLCQTMTTTDGLIQKRLLFVPHTRIFFFFVPQSTVPYIFINNTIVYHGIRSNILFVLTKLTTFHQHSVNFSFDFDWQRVSFSWIRRSLKIECKINSPLRKPQKYLLLKARTEWEILRVWTVRIPICIWTDAINTVSQTLFPIYCIVYWCRRAFRLIFMFHFTDETSLSIAFLSSLPNVCACMCVIRQPIFPFFTNQSFG